MKIVFLAAFTFAVSVLSAAVDPAPLFNHGVVLQRNRPVPIWGTASVGEVVVVEFAGQRLETCADQNGRWRVDLKPLETSEEPRTLRIGNFVCTNVVVGEVWLASGQSNMELELWRRSSIRPASGREWNGYYDARLTDEPMVRGCRIPVALAAEPTNLVRQSWFAFTPQNTDRNANFSAVAFHFALRLRQALKVPVGVVVSSWGGSRIEPWIPACGFRMIPQFQDLATRPISLDLTPKEEKILEEERKRGGWRTKSNILYKQPRSIYNAMIFPLEPFAFRGVIWYQGEANRLGDGLYYNQLVALKRGWAERFENPDMAFFLTQIAPYFYGRSDVHDTGKSRIREEMERFGASEKGAGCVPAGDVGETTNIHPCNKRTVATRLAAMALNRTYGRKDIVCEAPSLLSATIEGTNTVRLVFSNVKAWNKCNLEPEPFEVGDADGKFLPAKAAYPEPGVVVLTVPTGVEPHSVSFQRLFRQHCSIRNEAGLPPFPFVRALPAVNSNL